jgi:phosphoribosyl-ATP pyrophosphohydrolase
MADAEILRALMSVIEERKANASASSSYVASLLRGGVPEIGRKVREEAQEVVEAADEEGEAGREHLVKEVADLVFHAMVMLSHRGASWPQVEAELARRFGISGIAEKASRNKDPSA